MGKLGKKPEVYKSGVVLINKKDVYRIYFVCFRMKIK